MWGPNLTLWEWSERCSLIQRQVEWARPRSDSLVTSLIWMMKLKAKLLQSSLDSYWHAFLCRSVSCLSELVRVKSCWGIWKNVCPNHLLNSLGSRTGSYSPVRVAFSRIKNVIVRASKHLKVCCLAEQYLSSALKSPATRPVFKYVFESGSQSL